ncbi:MAG: CHAD domain-containing protein, partial [Blastococcus sp.]
LPVPLSLVIRDGGRSARLPLVPRCDRQNPHHWTEVGDGIGTPMSDPGGGQFWTGPDPSAVPAALTALATSYTVAMGPPVTTRRTWLDSVDFRLYRSGLALLATAGPDGDERGLKLSSTDGATITAGPDPLGWPRLLACLPHQLRPRLEPVLGVRALLPVVHMSGTSVTGRLLDVEGKTVLRVVHERPATTAASRDQLSGGLWLIPLRGYAAVGARVDRIAQQAGLVHDNRFGYPTALLAAGFDPDATGPIMEPGLPARVAVARMLVSFLDELEAAWDGTVTDLDIEFLHDLRVAVRRSRATVKLLGDVLPPASIAWVTPQLKWLGDLTTPSRDLDVLLQDLPALAGCLTSGRPEDMEPLVLDLIRLRADEQVRLVRGLRSARFERLRARWRASLEELAAWDGRPCAGPTAAQFGMERLASADRRVLRRGARITDASPAEDLHDLRKRAKELRYLLETFTPLLDPGEARVVVKELKALQDVLGTFQDSEAQREAIYLRAADMIAREGASARTMLAMGEIAARLQVEQDSSRAKFAAMFECFARRPGKRRMSRLRQPRTALFAAAATASAGATR